MSTKQKIDTALVWLLCVIIGIQMLVININLRISPSDVLVEIKSHNAIVTRNLVKLDEEIRIMKTELSRRSSWMEGIDIELQERTDDRIFRSQVLQWKGELKRLNQDLKVPEIPNQRIKKTIESK